MLVTYGMEAFLDALPPCGHRPDVVHARWSRRVKNGLAGHIACKVRANGGSAGMSWEFHVGESSLCCNYAPLAHGSDANVKDDTPEECGVSGVVTIL